MGQLQQLLRPVHSPPEPSVSLQKLQQQRHKKKGPKLAWSLALAQGSLAWAPLEQASPMLFRVGHSLRELLQLLPAAAEPLPQWNERSFNRVKGYLLFPYNRLTYM